MLVCPSGIDLSSSALRFLSGVLAARRVERGTRWRRLTTDRQALLVLAHLRCGHTYAQLTAGFGVGIATVYRYVAEAVEVLAALAPDLATAARKAFVILDGILPPIDRIVTFNSTAFRGYTGFDSATFDQVATFGSTAFRGSAGFESATFTGAAWFESATFRGDARFDSAAFGQVARFGSVKRAV